MARLEAVYLRRVQRAGFENVRIESDKVVGELPSDASDRTVALQIAKEEGWQITGNQVLVSE